MQKKVIQAKQTNESIDLDILYQITEKKEKGEYVTVYIVKDIKTDTVYKIVLVKEQKKEEDKNKNE